MTSCGVDVRRDFEAEFPSIRSPSRILSLSAFVLLCVICVSVTQIVESGNPPLQIPPPLRHLPAGYLCLNIKKLASDVNLGLWLGSEIGLTSKFLTVK